VSKFGRILLNTEYVFCSKLSCRLSVDACLKRQKANCHRTRMQSVPFPECVECYQGKKHETLKSGLPATAKPRKGNGKRKMDCQLYEICLDTAAKSNWKAFDGDGCDHQKKTNKRKSENPEKMNIKRLCRTCGKKPPLHKNNEMCASCMSKKSWEKRKSKNKGSNVPNRKQNAEGTAHSEEKSGKPVIEHNSAITIDFGEHVAILREIEKLSIKELRPVDMQTIYMLKKQLLAIKQSP